MLSSGKWGTAVDFKASRCLDQSLFLERIMLQDRRRQTSSLRGWDRGVRYRAQFGSHCNSAGENNEDLA